MSSPTDGSGSAPGQPGADMSGGYAPPEGAPVYTAVPDQAVPEHHDLLRLCRHCSTQTVTEAPDCPVCGTPYVHDTWLTKNRVIAIAAVFALLVATVGGFALIRGRQAQMAEDQRVAAEQAAAAEQERVAAEARAAREAAALEAQEEVEAQRAIRAAMVPGIEKSVTKMAREHASDGVIEGWPRSTSCSPVAGQSIDNLNKTTTKFSCFVTTENLGGGRARGHYYQALMNWETGEYTYGYDD